MPMRPVLGTRNKRTDGRADTAYSTSPDPSDFHDFTEMNAVANSRSQWKAKQ
jgi:hypothetical protein